MGKWRWDRYKEYLQKLPSTPKMERRDIKGAATENPKRKIEVLVGLALDIALAVVPGVAPLNTIARWGMWSVAVGLLVFGLQFVLEIQFFRVSRLFVAIISAIVFALSTLSISIKQWREEQSQIMEGIIGSIDPRPDEKTILETGDGSTGIPIQKNPTFNVHILRDADLIIEPSASGPLVTTLVRDRYGKELVRIDRNHWRVTPSALDHNYTNNALEVKDAGDHVVLQVELKGNKVILQGEWHNEFGDAAEWCKCLDQDQKEPRGGCIHLFGTKYPDSSNRIEIKPLFLYPSLHNWGNLVIPPNLP